MKHTEVGPRHLELVAGMLSEKMLQPIQQNLQSHSRECGQQAFGEGNSEDYAVGRYNGEYTKAFTT